MTKEQESEIILLRAKGWSYSKIAARLQISPMTARKYGSHPANKAVQAMVERDVVGVTPKERRTIQKELAMQFFQEHYEEFLQLVLRQAKEKDPRGFAHAMQGIEKIDRVSGNAVGEGQKVEVVGIPPAQVDLKVLIQQILGKSNGAA